MMIRLYFIGIAVLISLIIFNQPALATVDPRLAPNNKVGINSLSPEAEVKEVAKLVNTNGDWGWVVIVIKKGERNLDRWQSLFHLFAKYHLIPIVRIATDFNQQGTWRRPSDEDANTWADFLSKLYWPTKNRYVQIYNEVNRASEWGGKVDAASYAKELAKTINALKDKSEDFFVMSAPLDLALPTTQDSLSADIFYQTMEAAVPGIFNKLDGWASHSYPNPNFSANPYKGGRVGIEGYRWELSQISSYIKNKNLPVFITETGWKRAINLGIGLNEEQIANYYKIAFEKVWDDKNIVVVAPFVFDFPEANYYPFSFKRHGKNGKKYFAYFDILKDLPKVQGTPERENLINEKVIEKPNYTVVNFLKEIKISFRNTGNYIWDTDESLKLEIESANFQLGRIVWNKEEIFPGQKAVAVFTIKSKKAGEFPLKFRLISNNQNLWEETIVIKSETIFSWIINKLKGKI